MKEGIRVILTVVLTVLIIAACAIIPHYIGTHTWYWWASPDTTTNWMSYWLIGVFVGLMGLTLLAVIGFAVAIVIAFFVGIGYQIYIALGGGN